jgi:hypothetical protein
MLVHSQVVTERVTATRVFESVHLTAAAATHALTRCGALHKDVAIYLPSGEVTE